MLHYVSIVILKMKLQVFREVLEGPLGWYGLYNGIGIKAMSMGAAGALMAIFIPFFEKLFTRYKMGETRFH